MSKCTLELMHSQMGLQVEYKQVQLKREKVELSSVFSTAMTHDGHQLGYIRLANFSQSSAHDMQKAIARLEVWAMLSRCLLPVLLPLPNQIPSHSLRAKLSRGCTPMCAQRSVSGA